MCEGTIVRNEIVHAIAEHWQVSVLALDCNDRFGFFTVLCVCYVSFCIVGQGFYNSWNIENVMKYATRRVDMGCKRLMFLVLNILLYTKRLSVLMNVSADDGNFSGVAVKTQTFNLTKCSNLT